MTNENNFFTASNKLLVRKANDVIRNAFMEFIQDEGGDLKNIDKSIIGINVFSEQLTSVLVTVMLSNLKTKNAIGKTVTYIEIILFAEECGIPEVREISADFVLATNRKVEEAVQAILSSKELDQKLDLLIKDLDKIKPLLTKKATELAILDLVEKQTKSHSDK